MNSKLFDTTSLGGFVLKNRIVRSATWEGMASDDGSCTPALVGLISGLAKGKVGLIISGFVSVSPEGQAGSRRLAVYDDGFIRGLSEMVQAAHDGGSRIVLQLAHAGVQADTNLTKLEAIGPSTVSSASGSIGRAMTPDEIGRTTEAFVAAARRAQAAGFDGVQIHAAHGYLLSQFLSPYFNRRTDEFGGTRENRSRVLLAILERTKAVCGRTFPVLIKLNSEDFIDGGLTVEESLRIAEILEQSGMDAIEISGGTGDAASQFTPIWHGGSASDDREVYYREAAERFKATIGVPLILVGGIRSYTVAERLIEEGIADYISLGRPFIREPHLVARWKSGDTEKSACRSCNLCFRSAKEGDGICCVAERRQREKEKSRQRA